MLRQTGPTTAFPLKATAAGSSAAARHLWTTQGSIDLIRDSAAVYKCSKTTSVVQREEASKPLIRNPSHTLGPL